MTLSLCNVSYFRDENNKHNKSGATQATKFFIYGFTNIIIKIDTPFPNLKSSIRSSTRFIKSGNFFKHIFRGINIRGDLCAERILS